MKRKARRPKAGRSTGAGGSSPDGNVHAHGSSSGRVSGRRLIVLRLCVAIFIPLLALGALELALRIIGYGYSPRYFLRTRIEGRDFYVTNEKFGLRFLTPETVRRPLRLRMVAEKPADSFRIFLFGESAALGDPEPTYGVGRYLEVLLRDRFPGTRFEVVPAAMTAINSHALLPVARECARRNGDLWIVYMGNNEIVGPFGAGTVFGPRAPGLRWVRILLAVKSTRIGQLLEAAVNRLRSTPGRRGWGGMGMFLKHTLQYDDPDRVRSCQHFKKNLDDMLRAGTRAGVPIILSTVASNLKDCAPFASSSPGTMSEAQKPAWAELCRAGIQREGAGAYGDALSFYQKAADLEAQVADLQFRFGSCWLALSNSANAKHHFELARDYDTLVFRADGRINGMVRDAAARYAHKGVHFLDAAELLSQAAPAGVAGQESFYEHVHLNFEGNYLLARAFAEETAKLLPDFVRARAGRAWASAEVCDRRLAVTAWDRHRVWQMNLARIGEPPFSSQPNHAARVRFYQATLAALQAQAQSERGSQGSAVYEAALALAPEDYLLHGNFAEFLEAKGELARAIEEEKRVHALLPHEPVPCYKMGRTLVRQGKSREAAEQFSRAVALRPDFWLALNELGVLAANQGRFKQGAGYFRRALRAYPDDPDTHINLGFLEQEQGRVEEALAHYRAAAQLNPSGAPARFCQAVEKAQQKKMSEAVECFRQAVQSRPDLWQAQFLLGDALAVQQEFEKARAHLAQAASWRPDYAPARLSLGSVLVELGRVEEARNQFEEALRLNPQNEQASAWLRKLQAPR